MPSAVLVAITHRCQHIHQIALNLLIPHARTAHLGLAAAKHNTSLKL